MGAGATRLKFNEVVTYQLAKFLSPGQWGPKKDYFWALQNVSFEISPGELVAP